MIDDIIEEYRATFKEEIPKEVLEELSKKYDEDGLRRILGISVARGKRVSKLSEVKTGDYVRLKIVKKRGEKDVQEKHLISYIASDGTDFCVLTDRANKGLQEGSRYIIGPVRIREKQRPTYLGNRRIHELYIYQSTDVFNVYYRKEVELEEFEIDPRPFAYKYFLASIKGRVKRVRDNAIVLATDYGDVYVRAPKYLLSKAPQGSLVKLYGVHPDKNGLALSEIGKIEVLEEAKTSKIRGVLIDVVRKVSMSKNPYIIYVLYDGSSLLKAFSRESSKPEADVGDVVEIVGRPISKGITVDNIEVISKGVVKNVEGIIKGVEEVSKFSPKYLVKLEGARVFTDTKYSEGSPISIKARGNDLEGTFVGKEIEENVATVVNVEYDEENDVSEIIIDDGENQIVIELEGDKRDLLGKDVKIIYDEKGNVKDLVPIRTSIFILEGKDE